MIEFYGGYQVYSESGVDLTLLRENLKRSLAARWEDNSRALPFLEMLRASSQGGSAIGKASLRRNTMLDVAGIIRQLNSDNVEYVIIGGLAMIAQGSAYNTRDFDLCYNRTAQNIAATAKAFASVHPYLRGAPAGLPFRFDEATIQAGLNFTLTTDLGDVDLLGEISGVGDYQEVFAQSEERTLDDLKVRVLSLSALIASKKAAGRAKDLKQLVELEELKKIRDAGQ